jgi:N-acylneuraminate cytidylyltransferase|tara:strand:- start:913 stop:1605 length:693 start_codon:yes stop_codon:yes gene_type:complete
MNVCIIPARKGSKRIKNKNIKLFCGKPIIYYPLKLSIKSKLFDKIIVSTDSKIIENISKKFGADLVIQRPKNISGDKTNTATIIRHAIRYLNKISLYPKFVCCVYPTSVFAKKRDLKRSYIKLKKEKLDFIFSAQKLPYPIQRTFYKTKKKIKMFIPKYINKNSQDLVDGYYDSAQFYWAKKDFWMKKNNIFSGKSNIYKLGKFQSVDINDQEDWNYGERLFKILNKCLT